MNTADTASASRPRFALILLFLVFATPVLLAWLVFYVFPEWQPSGTTNHGRLIEPVRPLPAFELDTLSDGRIDETFLRGKWTLVYWLGDECGANCIRHLYTLRQVRLAQGKNIDRLQRLMLWSGEDVDGAQRAGVQKHYPGLVIASVPDSGGPLGQVFALDAAAEPSAGRAYLVDPLGNLMMVYEPDDDPRGMIKDLEKLLKWSGLG